MPLLDAVPVRTVADVLGPALAAQPDALALVARSARLTYRELDRAADRAAAALWSFGVRQGDRVAACLPNDVDVVTAFHGALRLGAVWVGVGEALARVEQEELVRRSGARVLLAGPACTAGGPARRVDGSAWAHACAQAPDPPAVDVRPDDAAGIAWTSGTTGEPKGVVHSHRNLLLPGEVLVATRGWGPELRKGDCLPLTILNLQVLASLTTARAGGTCVVMDRRDAEGVADWVACEGVTVWNGAPTQLHDLARRPDLDLSALREVWSGGSDCSEQLRAEFARAHGLAVRGTYGLTEAPTVVSIDPAGDAWRPGASGQVLPHLQVVVVAPDGGPLPAGETGELVVTARSTGPWQDRWTPALGHWVEGRVERWSGPLATGDLGTVDADGWLSVLDRLKLVVVRGGANVYPAEVERVLRAQPGVAAVAVFGVPDPRLGERVAALVQPTSPGAVDLDALRDACADLLARYKVPERWGVVDSLPTNAMGKVVRRDLPDLLPDLATLPHLATLPDPATPTAHDRSTA